MKLKEIICQTDWQDVAIAIVTQRPCQRKALGRFMKVFESLVLMEPVATEYQIRIEQQPEGLNSDRTFPVVVGVKKGVDERWSLAFCSWTEWLGMEVCRKTMETYSNGQIVANCLHEMTFFGFTEDDIKRHGEELEDSVREAEEHPEDCVELSLEDWRIEISTKGYLRCLDRWLRWGWFAREYFGENDAWFKEHFLRKMAPEYFDEVDRQTLKAALKEVAREIGEVAEEM